MARVARDGEAVGVQFPVGGLSGGRSEWGDAVTWFDRLRRSVVLADVGRCEFRDVGVMGLGYRYGQ